MVDNYLIQYETPKVKRIVCVNTQKNFTYDKGELYYFNVLVDHL